MNLFTLKSASILYFFNYNCKKQILDEPECEIRDDVSEAGLREVEADAAEVLQPHLRRVLVLQHVPVAHKLDKWKREMI